MRLRLTIRGDEAICDWTDSDEQAQGSDQRHLRRHGRLLLQRLPARRLQRHPDQLRLPTGRSGWSPVPARSSTSSTRGPRSAATRRPTRTSRTSSSAPWPAPCRSGSPASEGASSCNFLFGGFHPEYGDYYTNYHIEGSGWGGTIDHDGNSVLCPNNGNCRNTPVEILETKYPFLVEEYQIAPRLGRGRPLAGRPGQLARLPRHRAGDHRQRPLRPHAAPTVRGIFGGARGASSGIFIQRAGDDQFRRFSEVFGTVSDSKFTRVVVTEGDRIRLESAGGGGFGDPTERPRELVAEDVRQGFVSRRGGARAIRLCRRGGGVMAEWRENDAQWYEERMLHCALCGRMIAKHYLAVDYDAGPKDLL